MNSALSHIILGQLQASVSVVADEAIVLTTSKGDQIELPRSIVGQDLQVGDRLMLELKKNELYPFEDIIKKAQKDIEEEKKQEQMRKLLEELIN